MKNLNALYIQYGEIANSCLAILKIFFNTLKLLRKMLNSYLSIVIVKSFEGKNGKAALHCEKARLENEETDLFYGKASLKNEKADLLYEKARLLFLKNSS